MHNLSNIISFPELNFELNAGSIIFSIHETLTRGKKTSIIRKF